MQLYLIRHGQSANNALWAETGQSKGRTEDPELTDYGKQQAEQLAQFLSRSQWPRAVTEDARATNIEGFHITHIYASLMTRSLDTAAPLAAALGLTPVARDDVHELGGIWLENEETGEREGLAGQNRAYFRQRFAQFILPAWLGETGWWSRPYETDAQQRERARKALESLKAAHLGTDDRVVVINHGGFYNRFLQALLQLSPELPVWFEYSNCGITRIDFREDGSFRIAYHNRVDHLPPHLIT